MDSVAPANNPLSDKLNRSFAWALGLSIAFHLVMAYVVPNFEFEPKKTPEVIEVELMEIKKPEPPPPPPPELPQPTPQPIKPDVKPKPTPQPKPEPTPRIIKPSEDITPPPSTPAPVQQEVIAVAPKAEAAPPTFTAPVAEPTPPAEPVKPQVSDEDIENAKNRYGNALAREIAKHKQYPKIAQMRGWQGEVLLNLYLDSAGRVIRSEVANSSGFESLDNQALAMVKKSNFPTPPEALKGRSFEISVPVTFKLE